MNEEKSRYALYAQDLGIAILLIVITGGVIGGWIALFKQFGVL